MTATRTASSWREVRRARLLQRFPWDVAALLRRCSTVERLPLGGVLLRAALSESEQQWLYEHLYELADRQSEEWHGLHATRSKSAFSRLNPDNRPQPFVTWVHPYTRRSNATSQPTSLLGWAEAILHSLVADSRTLEVDSMLAQLYASGGSLLKHRDEDLGWGVGVSLGCAADFDCYPESREAQKVIIRSGDIIVGEFGQMRHAVYVPPGEPPGWWATVDSFGNKMRCNVLFRQALSRNNNECLRSSAHYRCME